MRGRESPAEARHGDQAPEHGHHTDQGGTAALARRSYLQRAGGGLAAALIGSITRPAELRTRDGKSFLTVAVVADGVRLADEPPATVRVEYHGDDAEALAPRLTKNALVYAEGRLTLNSWTGSNGAERTGLNIRATHVEILGRARE